MTGLVVNEAAISGASTCPEMQCNLKGKVQGTPMGKELSIAAAIETIYVHAQWQSYMPCTCTYVLLIDTIRRYTGIVCQLVVVCVSPCVMHIPVHANVYCCRGHEPAGPD